MERLPYHGDAGWVASRIPGCWLSCTCCDFAVSCGPRLAARPECGKTDNVLRMRECLTCMLEVWETMLSYHHAAVQAQQALAEVKARAVAEATAVVVTEVAAGAAPAAEREVVLAARSGLEWSCHT